MIVPMKKAAGWQPFFISITDRRLFLHRSACPNGEHPYQKTEDGKTGLRLLFVESAQQMPMVFMCSVYD